MFLLGGISMQTQDYLNFERKNAKIGPWPEFILLVLFPSVLLIYEQIIFENRYVRLEINKKVKCLLSWTENFLRIIFQYGNHSLYIP